MRVRWSRIKLFLGRHAIATTATIVLVLMGSQYAANQHTQLHGCNARNRIVRVQLAQLNYAEGFLTKTQAESPASRDFFAYERSLMHIETCTITFP